MQALTKSELIERIFEQHLSLTNREAEAAVKEVFRAIACALASGIRVEYRGFGSFNLKWHEARLSRNPKTGEAVHVPAKYVPHFQVGKELRDALNEQFSKESRD